MTYGCDLLPGHVRALDGAVVSHSAELVRGNFTSSSEGPLIRPSGTFSPRGEGFPAALTEACIARESAA